MGERQKHIEGKTKKTQGKLIKCKSAERALPSYGGTPDLDLLEMERKKWPDERMAATVDIRKNG